MLSFVFRIVAQFLAALFCFLPALIGSFTPGSAYTIPQIDLSAAPADVSPEFATLYEQTIVDDSRNYLAHPDSVLLKNGNILTMYPAGHGKGAVLNKVSTDGGRTYSSSIPNTPASWVNSQETPTVYRLQFTDGKTADKLIMISANPDWGSGSTGGFNCSLSTDEGQSWTEFETFYGEGQFPKVVPIVAMSSLTQLKENGQFVDKWMGVFHDAHFTNYKTILTFDQKGNMHWSIPTPYFVEHWVRQYATQMCEVEIIRSDGGQGDELCLITRSNTKKSNSLISFSQDEGKTWSEPREVPAALNGERHKAEWTKDGRLFITFRSIERDPDKNSLYGDPVSGRYSEGWIAWVGTYEDLKNGTEGQYRIKLAHTYLAGQTQPQAAANADTGYCGNVVLGDGIIVTSSYGCFDPTKTYVDENGTPIMKTYIVSKRIDLRLTDRLAGIA
ncbi:MAG TPA: exo-alpha-sialidase [Candidatus Fimivicinus intestinavium]|nr:exo-alpha-sialidase [Candidatus Fimivicinus intestinavium]